MKRFVQEVANECLRDLDRLERFAFATARYYGTLTAESEKEIRKAYAEKREKVQATVEQCRYGYISELAAVKIIVEV